jgi:hypothetical protein
MDTLIPAAILVAIIGIVVGFMVFINNRDRKKDALKKLAEKDNQS